MGYALQNGHTIKSQLILNSHWYNTDCFIASSHKVQHRSHPHQTESLPHRESHSFFFLQVNNHTESHSHSVSCCLLSAFLPLIWLTPAGGGSPASCWVYAWLRIWRQPSPSLNKDVSFNRSLVCTRIYSHQMSSHIVLYFLVLKSFVVVLCGIYISWITFRVALPLSTSEAELVFQYCPWLGLRCASWSRHRHRPSISCNAVGLPILSIYISASVWITWCNIHPFTQFRFYKKNSKPTITCCWKAF